MGLLRMEKNPLPIPEGKTNFKEEEGIYCENKKEIRYVFLDAGGENIALISPGMGKQKEIGGEGGAAIARELADKGISSIRYEIQTDEEVPTLGKMTDSTRLMNHLAKQKGFKNGVTYIIGTSLSGFTPLIAASNLKNVKKVVLRSPLVDFADMIEKNMSQTDIEIWAEKHFLPKNDSVGENFLPWELYQQYQKRRPQSEKFQKIIQGLKQHSTNVMIIHGSNDTIIPLKYSQALIDTLKQNGINAELEIIPGANHDYQEDDSFKDSVTKLAGYLSQ